MLLGAERNRSAVTRLQKPNVLSSLEGSGSGRYHRYLAPSQYHSLEVIAGRRQESGDGERHSEVMFPLELPSFQPL
jgi:hypothetical protein